MGLISAPCLLNGTYDIAAFDCGNTTLSEWLIKRAIKNQQSNASRTFVVCDDNKVVGYYALASGSVERTGAPKTVARNMPDPIPVMVLGRLAVDLSQQGQQLGAALLKDALLRVLAVSHQVGIRAVLVHAISANAKQFYLSYGFRVSPMDSMTLMLPVQHIEALL